MSDVLSVSILNGYIHQIFVAEEMLHNVKVAGEISQYKVAGGHAYFVLKDENCQINCTYFNCLGAYQPKAGESVVVEGSVEYYAKGGRLNFNVKSIKPLGAGYLALLFEQLKKKLSEQGYFDSQHKKPIPEYLKKVCVITSAQGAVIRDIITTVRNKNNYIDIVVKDVRVQGESCAGDIIRAIEQVDSMGYDAIIIARGGGSIEDLQGFNSENLVYAIYHANTPIISAVGHETDFTLCDFVADVRCATPTAAANLIAFDTKETALYLQSVKEKLMEKLERKAENYASKRQLLYTTLQSIFTAKAERASHRCQDNLKNLNQAMSDKILQTKMSMQHLLTKFKSLDPVFSVEKGLWSVSCDGKPLTEPTQAKVNQQIQLKSVKGKLTAIVTEVSNEL
ncbi:MAG: exodeoxyribonuclease VII large subunit [Christensenellales bacterium]